MVYTGIAIIMVSVPFFLVWYGRTLDENQFLKPLFNALSLLFIHVDLYVAKVYADGASLLDVSNILDNALIIAIGYLIWIIIIFYALGFFVNVFKILSGLVKQKHG